MVTFKQKNKILIWRMTEVTAKVKSFTHEELFFIYESFDVLLTSIFNIFENQNFCKRTRLFTYLIFMLFKDLIQIYKDFYVVVTEILERFVEFSYEQSKKAYIIYHNFVNLTNIMKSKADKIMYEFKFDTISLPKYYVPEEGLMDTLKYCIENKDPNSTNLK